MDNVKVNVEEIMREIRAGIQRNQDAGIDIERIMDEIRAQAREIPAEGIPPFQSARAASESITVLPQEAAGTSHVSLTIPSDGGALRQIANEVDYLKDNSQIPYYWEQIGKGPKNFVKRAVRRVNRFLFFPISERQNGFNQHAANGIDALSIGLGHHQDQLNILYASAQEQQVRTDAIDSAVRSQKAGLDAMESTLRGQQASVGALFAQQQGAIDSAAARVDEQQKDIDEAKARADEQDKAIEAAAARADEQDKAIEAAAARADEQDKAIEAAAARADEQQEAIEAAAARADKQEKELSALSSSIRNWEERTQTRQDEDFERLDEHMQSLEARINANRSELAAHGAAIEDQRRGSALSAERFGSLQHRQDVLALTLDAHQRDLSAQRDRLNAVGENIEREARLREELGERLNAVGESVEREARLREELGERLNAVGESVEREARLREELGERLNATVLASMDERQKQLEEIVRAASGEGIAENLQAVASGLAEHGKYLQGQQEQLARQQEALEAALKSVREHEQKLAAMDSAIDAMSLSIARTIRMYLSDRARAPEAAPFPFPSPSPAETAVPGNAAQAPQAQAGRNDYEVIDYFQFENHFRGSQSQIMERQRQYVPYFRGRKGKVFDFGCGRGEFLRLLKEEGIPAFGMDTYEEYEITAQLHGVDVRAGDAFGALEAATEPLGGVFCAQVVEHIGLKNIEKLCKLAYEKLEEGAYIILETPNPMCVSTFTNSFYLDPTHERPVHPLMMEYLLKSIGYSEVRLLWPDHSLEQLPKIQGEGISNLDEVNRAIERVSNLLFGSQDYAVVARK